MGSEVEFEFLAVLQAWQKLQYLCETFAVWFYVFFFKKKREATNTSATKRVFEIIPSTTGTRHCSVFKNLSQGLDPEAILVGSICLLRLQVGVGVKRITQYWMGKTRRLFGSVWNSLLPGELRPTLQKKTQLRLKTKTLQLTNLLKRKVIILHINSQTTENKGRKKMAAHLQASSRNVIGD